MAYYLIKEENKVNSIYIKTFLGLLKLGTDNQTVNKNEKLKFLLNTENCNEILLTNESCLVSLDDSKIDELGYIHLTKI